MKSNTTRSLIYLMVGIVVVMLTVLTIWLTQVNQPVYVSATEIQVALAQKKIVKVNSVNDRIEVRFKDSDKKANAYDVYTFARESNLLAAIYSYNDDMTELVKGDVDKKETNTNTISNAVLDSLYKELTPAYTTSGVVDQQKLDAAVAEAFDSAYRLALDEEYSAALEEAKATGIYIDIKYNDRYAPSFWDFLPTIGFIVLLIIMGVFFFRTLNTQNKQTIGFGKNKANSQTNIKIRFSDVAGAEEEKVELQEIVEFLKAPQKFTKVGARIPRGVLMVGPPGTGKTLFAKAVAGEANVPFFSISGSDFVEMFVGVGASRVRDLFDQAKRNMPCIIFIDEIDAVGRQRGAGLGGGHDEREQTLNQLLVQMDGFETNDGIIVMAATNRADILDPALLRPGRFDRQIYVHIPDVRGREAIFKVHARNKPMSPDIDFQILARITSGFTGADIANLLNEAAILCARDDRTHITMNDINEGINKVVIGPQKKSRLVTEPDKRITAYHEVGHAIVGKICKKCGPVHEVSIIPRGAAGGYTMSRPDNDDQYESVNKLNDYLARSMGGRAAEAIVLEDITSGASADIKSATEIAHRMVTEWGMSGNKKLGQVFYGSSKEVFLGRDYQSTHNYSEMTASEIDKEVSRIVEDGYKHAFDILTKYRKEMDVMARVLLECETIYTEEVDMIMEGADAESVKAALEARLQKKYGK